VAGILLISGQTESMKNQNRVLTIDIMRGLTLFLMLFVNDLFVPGVPKWMVHTDANFDGMGLADWVFPGFLFMVGMAIPFAMQSRIKRGENLPLLLVHVIVRTISLLIIGLLSMNASRLNPELSGISRNLWAILMLVSVFLVWNQYKFKNRNLLFSLKALGVIGLIVLCAIFRSGTPEAPGWMETSWWGILGLIGWGYLAAALVYLVSRENLLFTGLFFLLFLVLNILGELNLTGFLNSLRPVFGVLISGNIPMIVIAGLFFSVLLRRLERKDLKTWIFTGLILGVVVLVVGFVLRYWFIISKIKGTPSWGMVCTGISILVFMFLYLVIDVWGLRKWVSVFTPAGQNSLTTYLAPDVLYHLIWMFSIPVFFYKHAEMQWMVVGGSVIWAFAMIGFAALLAKIGIRLKL
jgi:predicted acyltransferase